MSTKVNTTRENNKAEYAFLSNAHSDPNNENCGSPSTSHLPAINERGEASDI